MIYLDTSVLVALHLREPSTDALHSRYATTGDTTLATAVWTMTESASALSVKLRTGQVTKKQAAVAWKSFDEHCSRDLHLLDCNRSTFVRAAELTAMIPAACAPAMRCTSPCCRRRRLHRWRASIAS